MTAILAFEREDKERNELWVQAEHDNMSPVTVKKCGQTFVIPAKEFRELTAHRRK